ncbi:MAG TPA: hypothetical protein VFY26_22275 [Anaerolineales bacterium]|nr:hypothetical protein [Anaerolineales bacterium]
MISILLLLALLLPILLLLVPASIFRTLRSWSQTLNWEAGLLLASLLAYLGYVRIDGILGPPIPLPAYVFWALKLLALISPTCIAVAWLRWTGVQWATALKLLPIVPVGAFTIWLSRQVPLMMG